MNIADILLVIIILFTLAVVTVMGNYVLSMVNDDVQSDGEMSNLSRESLDSLNTRYPETMDSNFAIVLVLFWIFLLISSFLIDTHPIFFIISVILLLLAFIVAMVISNTYQDVGSDTDIAPFADNFPIINFVMGNLLLVVIAIGFSVVIVLYGKNKWSG
jgi:hypothetical protein